MNIVCFAKQVMDPEAPMASFKIDEANNKVMPVQGVAPVVNGFDETPSRPPCGSARSTRGRSG